MPNFVRAKRACKMTTKATNDSLTGMARQIYAFLSPPRRREFYVVAFMMFCMAFVELGVAGCISLLGVAMSAPESFQKLPILPELLDAFPIFPANMPMIVSMLIVIMCCVCVATIVKNGLLGWLTWRQGLFANGVSWDMACRIFSGYMNAPYVWHLQHNSADLSLYVSWKVYVSQFMMHMLNFITQMGIAIVLLIGAFSITPAIAAMVFCITGAGAWGIYCFARRKAQNCGHTLATLDSTVTRTTMAALHGVREVHIYRQQNAFIQQFSSVVPQHIRYTNFLNVYTPLPTWVLECIGMTILFAAVCIMGFTQTSVAYVTGTLTLMAAVSWRLLPAANKSVGAILAMRGLLHPLSIFLKKMQEAPVEEVTTTVQIPFTHSVKLRNVSFGYPRVENNALSNINFSIHKGSMVGIIGLSGSGKSTLVGVLTGLLVPQKGDFCIDGAQYTPRPGLLNVGYVPQSPYLLDSTLAENVAFSRWGEAVNKDRVEECCRMAAMEFLQDLPQGIDTVMGERGVRLSGGQIQRVAIARALYNNPDFLLFDEATSALDGAAEAVIQQTVLQLRDNITVVMVAHRLSTVEKCDYVYWLNNGSIFREGSAVAVLNEYEQFIQNTENS